MPDQWLNIHGRFAGKVFMAGFSATTEKPFDPPPWLQPGPQTWELRRGSCDARSLVAWAASAAFDRPARRGAEMRRGAALPQAGQGLGRAASDIGRKASNSVAQAGQLFLVFAEGAWRLQPRWHFGSTPQMMHHF